MAKEKRSLSFKKAEIMFGDEITIIEHEKEEDIETNLEDALRKFDGCANLTISITTESEL